MKTPVLESLFKNSIKKGLQYRCFPKDTGEFLRTPTLKNIYERLLFKLSSDINCRTE